MNFEGTKIEDLCFFLTTGDILTDGCDKYIIAQTDMDVHAVISMRDGNRYTKPVKGACVAVHGEQMFDSQAMAKLLPRCGHWTVDHLRDDCANHLRNDRYSHHRGE